MKHNIQDVFKNKNNTITELIGNGDFRSDECVELLKEVDIVVTNPPFSLFREYIALMEEYNKKYIVWGNNNAITYKEIFPLIKENKLWLGYTANKTQSFRIPLDYALYNEKLTEKMSDGNKYATVPSISVFTNLDIKKRHKEIIFNKKYNNLEYALYDNYNAIEVPRVADIPYDYSGIMGVPITFLAKHNPEQFEILGSQRWSKSDELLNAHTSNDKEVAMNDKKTLINGKETYDRIFIKFRKDELILRQFFPSIV